MSEDDQIQEGTQIGQWYIEKKLGEGGCGAVYRVRNKCSVYALKVEGINEKMQVLKMEVSVLQQLQSKGGRHFCRIADKGRFTNYNFVVMTLVGQSLHDLRKGLRTQMFSLPCALSVAIQCLEGLEDLHDIGYLHRDVKPGNYTVGRADTQELRKVYVLDFGMARKFTGDNGELRKPRTKAAFRGTIRYAPINCHLQQELSRKDDLETWMYMMVELTASRLPWRELNDIKKVGEFKKKVRKTANMSELFIAPCPKEYCEILKHLDKVGYYDEPNYAQIYALLRRAISATGKSEFPYDWEPKGTSGAQRSKMLAPTASTTTKSSYA